MQNIDIYNNSEIIIKRKESKIYTYFIVILSIAIILCILLFTKYKYKKVINVAGVYEDGFIKLILNKNQLNQLKNGRVLVNEKKYNVYINSIGKAVYDNNYNAYYEVFITLNNLDIKLENDLIEIKIILKETTLYEEIKELIKEEFKN